METKPVRQVPLISTARHIYRERSLKADDPFEASEEDADDLIAIGFAKRDKSGTYKRRDMKAEK